MNFLVMTLYFCGMLHELMCSCVLVLCLFHIVTTGNLTRAISLMTVAVIGLLSVRHFGMSKVSGQLFGSSIYHLTTQC